jgi:REP element-mobilizing transposase RayT
MPRKPRTFSSTGIYHIILRSVNQRIIFEEDSDYHKFLFVLRECTKKYDVLVYAYCLMDNHVHLLMKIPPDNMSAFFQSLGTRFVRWYNNKYMRIGHLFQDRYYSVAIEDDRAFLSVIAYIHNNPIKANICSFCSQYRWSSFNAYYGENTSFIDVSLAYNIAGSKAALIQFFAKEPINSENELFSDDHRDSQHFLTDERAIRVFKSLTHLSSLSDTKDLSKKQRDTFIRQLKDEHMTIKQISRLMDVSEKTVRRACQLTT